MICAVIFSGGDRGKMWDEPCRPKDKRGQRDKKRKVRVSKEDQDEEEEVCESSP